LNGQVRHHVAAIVTLALCLGCSAVPTQAMARAERGPVHRMTLTTMPAIAGVRISLDGRQYRTGADGSVRARLGPFRRAGRRAHTGTRFTSNERYGDLRIFARQWPATGLALRVRSRRLADGGVARLARYFHGGRVALALFYRFSPEFRAPDGSRVEPHLVQGYRLKSRTGEIVDVKGARSVTLQATRVVPFPEGLVSKDIEWSIERVMIDGTNVVNRAQNQFTPHRLKGRPRPVRLLFYPVKVKTTDAMFGFPIGKDLTVTYPNGKERRLALREGRAVIPALPRGTYTVNVRAPGLSPARAIAVSRPQEVELQVISWLDVAIVGLLLGSFTAVLAVARRPHLRRLPSLRRARPRLERRDAPVDRPSPARRHRTPG